MENSITLRFTQEQIRERLKVVFKADHETIMSECIVGLLHDNEHALELLFKASMGITPNLKYKVGDKVSVRDYGLPSWRFDVGAMVEQELIVKDYLEAKIIRVDRFKYEPYYVSFDYIDKDNKELVTGKYSIKPNDIAGIVENELEQLL